MHPIDTQILLFTKFCKSAHKDALAASHAWFGKSSFGKILFPSRKILPGGVGFVCGCLVLVFGVCPGASKAKFMCLKRSYS